VEIPNFMDPFLERVGGEYPIFVLDDLPDLVREPCFGHRPLVPLLLHLFLPFLPLARVSFADSFFAFLDARRRRLVSVDALAAGRGERRQRECAVTQNAEIPIMVLVVVGRPLSDLDVRARDRGPLSN